MENIYMSEKDVERTRVRNGVKESYLPGSVVPLCSRALDVQKDEVNKDWWKIRLRAK